MFPVVIEARDRAVLAAERAGVLDALNVFPGDRVAKGEVIATIANNDLHLKLKELQAKEKYYVFSVDNLCKLRDSGCASKEEVAKTSMERDVNAAQLDQIRNEILRTRIKAPFSGRVLERMIHAHEWVKPGQAVVEVYDPTHLLIMANIPAKVASSMKPGMQHTFDFHDQNVTVSGRLTVLVPQVDVRSNTVKVYWSVVGKNARVRASLEPGMKGVVQIGSK